MPDRRFKGVVFDMDGVIIDTELHVLECWNEAAMNHGVPDMTEVLKQCIGLNSQKTDDLILAKFGEYIDDLEQIRAEKRVLIKERIESGKVLPKPGVLEILTWLKENGYSTALATSTSGNAARHELDILDLSKFFDVMITGEQIPNGKPAPDIFLAACDALKIDPEELIGVEDSYNGIKSCHAAGLYTVMVPDLLPPTDEIRALADKIYDNVLCIKELFSQGGS
ncbi:MAG: HAD family phosphatase [Clostridiales bacterium]|nr:HAD family phosphatase [Clostridiales bacterium]